MKLRIVDIQGDDVNKISRLPAIKDDSKSSKDNLDYDSDSSEDELEDESLNKVEDSEYNIRIYGRNHEDKTVFIGVKGYHPSYDIELPILWLRNSGSCPKNGCQKCNICNLLSRKCMYIISHLKSKNFRIYYHKIVWQKCYRKFCGNEHFPCLRIYFYTKQAMYKSTYIFKRSIKQTDPENDEKQEIVDVKSQDIKINGISEKFEVCNFTDPLLKFIHQSQIDPAGYIEVFNYSQNQYRISTCDYDLEAHWKDIKKTESEQIPLRVMSYDIETYSSDEHSFPNFRKHDDVIYQIGCTFNYLQSSHPFKKILISLGTCDIFDKSVDVIQCKTEKEVLKTFVKVIHDIDPDVLAGYNTFGFDNEYMYMRAKKHKIHKEFSRWGRLNGFQCKYNIKDLSSSALGQNILKYYEMEGRAQIDLYKAISTDPSYKMERYTLDYVSSQFYQGDITEIRINNANDLIAFTTKSIDGMNDGDFIKLIIIEKLSKIEDVYDVKFMIKQIDQNVVYVSRTNTTEALPEEFFNPDEYTYKWSLSKDDITHTDIFKFFKKDSYHRSLIGKYCIQDCWLVSLLMEKLDILLTRIAMSNVSKVPLIFIILRGQGIKCESQLFYYTSQENYFVRKIYPCHNKQDSGYEGAMVIDPVPGYYTQPIVTLDYASLYPSCMREMNISPDMLVIDDKYLDLPGYEYNTIEYIDKDTNETVSNTFARKKGESGILCRMLSDCLTARKNIKKLMKKEADPVRYKNLDAQQLAMKITANSIYGQTGAKTSQLYCKQAAASTTARGRNRLQFAADFATQQFPQLMMHVKTSPQSEDEWNKIAPQSTELYKDLMWVLSNFEIKPYILYGDTDSIFINFQIKSNSDGYDDDMLRKAAIILGQACSALANEALPWPHDLEYEKTFGPFIIFSKKKYAGWKYEFDLYKYKLNYMGIVLKRRDNAKIVKKVCGSILSLIFKNASTDDIKEYVKELLQGIVNNRFDLSYFWITKTLKGNYKNPQGIAHNVLANRMKERDIASAPQINDRMCFVYIYDKTHDKKTLQGDKIEDINYVRDNNLPVDYLHYITNQIASPACQFLDLIVTNSYEELFLPIIEEEQRKRNGIKNIYELLNMFE